jgi:hypothetical protein
MKTRKVIGGLASALLGCGLFAQTAMADPVLGTLYYTTFAAGTNLHRVDFNWDGSTFALSNNTGLANLSGADGLLFGPNGNLLVGAQANNIIEVTPTGTVVTNRNPGGGSFHLALSSNSSTAIVYNVNNGGCANHCISAVQLSAGGLSANGFLYTVSGTNTSDLDVRGVIFDPADNTWYYGTAGDGATNGEFGTVAFDDTLHTAKLTRLLSNVPAHGLTYDPFTTDIIFSSDTLIQQYRPGLGMVISSVNFGGNFQFDQTAADGMGHLFGASNDGVLAFLDYDASGLIGTGVTRSQFLALNLDDVAPLSGLGSNQAPEPTTLALLGLGLAGIAATRRRRSS